MNSKKINKVLVANRGEIAVRIMKTLRKLHIASVAVFADNDANALHRRMADEACPLGSGALKDTYLNVQKIIDAALDAGADAIHPGYGFLSESPDLVEACEANNLIFIGPNAEIMRRYVMLPDGGWDWPLWKWKGPIITEGNCVYGKFFAGKAGFISREWWPDFCNYRRHLHPMPSEGSIEETILFTLQEQGPLITRELRAACGFNGPKMRSRFDSYVRNRPPSSVKR